MQVGNSVCFGVFLPLFEMLISLSESGRSLTYRCNQFEGEFISAVYCHEKTQCLHQNLDCVTFLLETKKNFLGAIALEY